MNAPPASKNWEMFTPKLFTVLKSGYSFFNLRSDALAGLTVAIVALPLAMALAIASGASPDKGLITAVIAGFFISFLGGSRVQIGGPTGAFVVVVFNIIIQHGYDGLVLATFLAGIILLIAGYARLGLLIKYIPGPVITGFTAGIAVIIASSQVKDFLGLSLENLPADFVPKWAAYFQHIDSVDVPTVSIGLATLFIILLLKKLATRIPGYLVAIVISAIIVSFLQMPVATIGSRFGEIAHGLPMPAWPVIDFVKFQEVLPSAFIIAFLAGIEALLSAVVADGMTGFKHRSNQELVGQGVANIASSLFGGLPATGAIARTATNIKAGGKTPVAGIFHALFLLIFMMLAADIMRFVPMAALAAILFIVSWGMSETHRFIHICKIPGSDRVILLLTFLLTVLVDLTVAIGVGVSLASLIFMARMGKAVEIDALINRDTLQNDEEENQRVDLPDNVEVFRIAGPIFFGVASDMLEALGRVDTWPKVLIVRMRLVPYLDATGGAALQELVKKCRGKGTEVIFSAVQKQPAKILLRMELGPAHVRYAENYEQAIILSKNLLQEQTHAQKT